MQSKYLIPLVYYNLALILFVICSVLSPAVYAMDLSQEDIKWLKNHPTIVVGTVDPGLPPFEDVINNKLTGIGPDILKQVTGKLGLSIRIIEFTTRQALMDAVVQGKVDVIMNATPNFTDIKHLIYSNVYADNELSIVTRRDNRYILDYVDLSKTDVVAVAGTSEMILIPETYPTAKLELAPTLSDALDRVEKGEADAFIGNVHAIRYYLALDKNDTFRIVGDANLPLKTLHFAFPNNHVKLAKLFNQALDNIGFRAQQQIFNQWIGIEPAPRDRQGRAALTLEQINLLSHLPRLNVSNLEPYKPFSFRNDQGEPSGLVEDYFSLVRRQLQFKVNRLPVSNLKELLQLARNGEIDLIPGLPPTEEAKEYLVFSKPYERFPLVIITRKETSNIQGIEDLGKARVAISERAEPIPTLLSKNKSLTLLHVRTAEEGLNMLANHKVDAYIGNLVVSDRIITEKYSNALKLAAPTGYYAELTFAVSKKYAYLMPLINHALENINPARRELIRNTWFPITFHEHITWETIVKEILPALLLMCFVMGALIIAYWRLRQEIQQRKRAQEMLAHQLAFQHALLETIPFPVLGKDEKNRYIAINSAFESLTGYARASILGKTPEECSRIGAMLSQEFSQEAQAAVTAGKGFHRSLCYANSNGEQREGLFWLNPFFNKKGALGGSVAVLVDVTDIRRSESRALISEALLTDITESLPVTVFQFRLSAQGDMCFTYVAGAPVSTFGLSAEMMMADHQMFYSLLHAEDYPLVRDALLKMQGTLQPFQLECRMLIKGQMCWIRASTGTGKREENGDVLWGGYFEDITESRKQKLILQQAKSEAELTAREKMAFLATMSHEIRTPVHGILGWLELLEKSPLGSEQQRMLALVQNSATHLTQIIDDVLDFSKIEAGRVSLENIPVDIRTFLSELMETVGLQAAQKKLTLSLHIDHKVTCKLMCDPVRLRQVLINFLSNALKFTSSGNITLQLSLLKGNPGSQQLRFSVSDTGIGIPLHIQHQLFSPFKQAEVSTTRRFGGTGLGLAISKGLAEQMQGQLSMVSYPGEGTAVNFDVTFAQPSLTVDVPAFQQATAIICSDDEKNAEALKQMLLALGITVVTQPAAAELRELIACYDLIFIDKQALLQVEPGLLEVMKVVRITSRYMPMDEQAQHRHYLLSSNPLSWMRVRNICHALLDKREGKAAPAVALPGKGALDAPLTREAALRNGTLILVAEDHPVSRELIQHQLHMLGYCFDLVEDGEQAWQAITTTDYGLAIVDCHMPYIDGLELTRQVRRREQQGNLRRLTMVALTAGVLEGQAEDCIAAGMDGYLRKPLDMAGLENMLTRYLPPKG